MQESISLIEPLMPSAENRQLVNLASELIEAAASLNQSVHPVLRKELGTLVRAMNCYYSNLIEGHRTLPRDIENVCLDQVKFMSALIEPEKVLTRMEIYTEEQIRLGNLLPNSFLLLKQLGFAPLVNNFLFG